MAQKLTKNIDRNISKVVEAGTLSESINANIKTSEEPTTGTTAKPNPQVSSAKQASPRRTFTVKERLKILEAYEACKTTEERGELLRKTGLYYARISYWRKMHEAGRLVDPSNKSKKSTTQSTSNRLAQENVHLKKKLSQAEAIIELQKKVCELLGQHVLPHESSEVN